MKKKLEAELISIAHRILKLKNRAELDQLQEETLKLYEKISVLRFVEDNFGDVKPTIGYASAEAKVEGLYDKANDADKPEPENKEDKKAQEPVKEEKEQPAAETKEANEEQQEDRQEAEAKNETVKEEKTEAATPEGESTEEANIKEEEQKPVEAKEEESKTEEPEHKIQLETPAAELKAEEQAVKDVFEKEQDSAPEEEEKAEDAEIKTIEPDKNAAVEKSPFGFDLAFERKAAPEEPKQQKEISFEDFHDYKEPEFIRKDDSAKVEPKQEQPKAEQPKAAEPQEEEADDWRNWEPKKDTPVKEEPRQEAPKEEPKPQPVQQEQPRAAAPQPAAATSRSLNDSLGKTINLGLNDRIAFEKHLFGGSGEDLNRVLSQLNTFDRFSDARSFINDLVKPDYNNWKGKEEYEERFLGLVEKKFD